MPPKVGNCKFGLEFVNKIINKYSKWGRAEMAPFGQSSEDVHCVVCGDARVKNLELNFVKSSSEVEPHVASDVIFEKGGGETITMNGGVGGGVVNKGHVCVFI